MTKYKCGHLTIGLLLSSEQVTPSSKCVGDLAIYLVTRGLTTKDIEDEQKAATIDFPASVIELLEGRLGFPHRGFPAKVSKAILKDRKPLTVSPSAALAPADFAAEKARLDAKWGINATPEDVVSSLLYPKVSSQPIYWLVKVMQDHLVD